jgi:hypothetical protein
MKFTNRFLWEPSVKRLWIRRGVFMGSIMGDENFLHSSACHKEKLYDIMGSHKARDTNIIGF